MTDSQGKEERTAAGLTPDIQGVLSYMFGPASGLFFLLVETRHAACRFHAAQSLVVFGPLSLLIVGLHVAFWFFSPESIVFRFFVWAAVAALDLGAALLWVFLMIRAWKLDAYEVPIAGAIAKSMAAPKPPTSSS